MLIKQEEDKHKMKLKPMIFLICIALLAITVSMAIFISASEANPDNPELPTQIEIGTEEKPSTSDNTQPAPSDVTNDVTKIDSAFDDSPAKEYTLCVLKSGSLLHLPIASSARLQKKQRL